MKSNRNVPSLWKDEDIFPEVTTFQRAVDRFFNGMLGPSLRLSRDSFMPPLNVREEGNEILVSVDLPGVKIDDVKIECRDDQLVISGERIEERTEGPKGRQYQECYYGNFVRTLGLPSGIDPEEIKADFQNGVLTVSIPKAQERGHKQIPIQGQDRRRQREQSEGATRGQKSVGQRGESQQTERSEQSDDQTENQTRYSAKKGQEQERARGMENNKSSSGRHAA